MPKMKTHHWARRHALHEEPLRRDARHRLRLAEERAFTRPGIDQSILDINATVRPHLAIVDGIVGMEGDGPIMGTPKPAGVLVMGTEPARRRCHRRPDHGNRSAPGGVPEIGERRARNDPGGQHPSARRKPRGRADRFSAPPFHSRAPGPAPGPCLRPFRAPRRAQSLSPAKGLQPMNVNMSLRGRSDGAAPAPISVNPALNKGPVKKIVCD